MDDDIEDVKKMKLTSLLGGMLYYEDHLAPMFVPEGPMKYAELMKPTKDDLISLVVQEKSEEEKKVWPMWDVLPHAYSLLGASFPNIISTPSTSSTSTSNAMPVIPINPVIPVIPVPTMSLRHKTMLECLLNTTDIPLDLIKIILSYMMEYEWNMQFNRVLINKTGAEDGENGTVLGGFVILEDEIIINDIRNERVQAFHIPTGRYLRQWNSLIIADERNDHLGRLVIEPEYKTQLYCIYGTCIVVRNILDGKIDHVVEMSLLLALLDLPLTFGTSPACYGTVENKLIFSPFHKNRQRETFSFNLRTKTIKSFMGSRKRSRITAVCKSPRGLVVAQEPRLNNYNNLDKRFSRRSQREPEKASIDLWWHNEKPGYYHPFRVVSFEDPDLTRPRNVSTAMDEVIICNSGLNVFIIDILKMTLIKKINMGIGMGMNVPYSLLHSEYYTEYNTDLPLPPNLLSLAFYPEQSELLVLGRSRIFVFSIK